MWKLATIAVLLVITLYLMQGNRRSFLSSPIAPDNKMGYKCPYGGIARGSLCDRTIGGRKTVTPASWGVLSQTCPAGRTLSGGMCWLP